MMEASPDMEFLRPYLKDEWRVVGYAASGDTHHVLLQSATVMRSLTFRTEDKAGTGQAKVTGYEDAILID